MQMHFANQALKVPQEVLGRGHTLQMRAPVVAWVCWRNNDIIGKLM